MKHALRILAVLATVSLVARVVTAQGLVQHVATSAGNSSTATLAGGASFTGTTDDLSNYAEITLNIYATPTSATGTLYFEFSPDASHWDVSVGLPVADPTAFPPIPLRTVLRYFRVRYVNDGVAQTALRLTTNYHLTPAKELTRFPDQALAGSEPVAMTGAILKAKAADGTFRNVDSSSSDPAGTERGLITRNIPSGTQPVNAAALPLPTGASTAARQDTGNTSVANIDGKFPAAAALSDTMANPTSSAIGSYLLAWDATNSVWRRVQVDAATGTLKVDPGTVAVTNANLDSPLSGIRTDLDKIPSQGQALSAASMPVVLPAAQVTTLTPPAAITGFALEAGHLATIDTTTTTLSANQTNGNQRTQLVGTDAGTGAAVVSATHGAATADLNDDALVVTIAAVSNALPVTATSYLTDQTSGTKATIKAGSTTPVAADPSLVVTVSPNTSLPLPTGASTAARQDTGNASLAAIAASLPTPTMGGQPVFVLQLPKLPAPFKCNALRKTNCS